MLRPTLSIGSLLLCLALASPSAAVAQRETTGLTSSDLAGKCDPWLKHYLFTGTKRDRIEPAALGSELIRLFVTGDPQTLRDVVRELGGRIGSMTGSIATVTIDRKSLATLAARTGIYRLELALPVALDQDSLVRHVSADRVHAGDPPLQHSVTGRGVVVGVIDSGIDFMHPEFLDDAGRSRLLSIWSQGETTGSPPDGFDYGSEWNRARIDSTLAGFPLVTQRDRDGHGTHVAAIAAGRNGLAPDAEIIMVQYGTTTEGFTTDMLDAASYIYRRAEAEGKPAVINASLGTIRHFHDGSDPLSRGLAGLLEESPGRIFVASSGNSGAARMHWGGFAVEADSLWTASNPQHVWPHVIWLRIADSSLAGFEISVQVDSSTSGGISSRIGQTPWRSVAAVASVAGFHDEIGAAGISITAASLGNGHCGVVIDAGDSSSYSLGILVRGKGSFDAWSPYFDPAPPMEKQNSRYRPVDSTMSIGTPGIAEQVITVGSYVNRASYQTLTIGMYPDPPATSGALSLFSSIGPRSDGLLKPDITAPGQHVISARTGTPYYNYLADWQQLTESRYIPKSGTSMAAPAVAGAIALYLEAHPSATRSDVRSAIERSARKDSHTQLSGPLPNSRWGMGKLDAFALVTSTIAMLPERSIPVASNGRVRSVPLPASETVMIVHDGPGSAGATLAIYNSIGAQIERFDLSEGSDRIMLDVAAWPAGIYHCRLVNNGVVSIGNLVIVR